MQLPDILHIQKHVACLVRGEMLGTSAQIFDGAHDAAGFGINGGYALIAAVGAICDELDAGQAAALQDTVDLGGDAEALLGTRLLLDSGQCRVLCGRWRRPAATPHGSEPGNAL